MERGALNRRWIPLAAALAVAASTTAPAAAATDVYVAFGDSNTSGVGDSASPSGYPPRLEKLLRQEGRDVEVRNFGLAGETTAEGLSRIDFALAGGGDCLLLMHGTNDITLVHQGLLSLGTVVFNLDQMGRRGQAKGFATYHATLIPRLPNALQDRDNFLTRRLAWEVRKLAVSRRWALVDPFWRFDPLLDPGVFGAYYWDEPSDRIGHLDAAGYGELAALFRDVVLGVDTVPPVPAGFTPGFQVLEIEDDTEIRLTLIEPRTTSGMQLKETALLVNGVEVAGPETQNRYQTDLVFQGPEGLGCRAQVEMAASDRAEPPNQIRRVLAIYDIAGRRVLRGDVDFDCRVDGADLILFARSFGSRRGDPRYALRFDFNRDNRINGVDFAILAENFGRDTL